MSRRNCIVWKNRHKSFFVVVLNGHIQKNSSIISKPRKKKFLAIACRQKKQIALCLTLSIYFSPAFARLADSRIVAKKKKKKTSKAKIGSARSGKGLVRFSHHVLLHECTLLSLRAFEDFSFPFLTILTSFATGTAWFRRSSW